MCFIVFNVACIFLHSISSGGGYHGYDESYGSPPYEGRRMGLPMRGRGARSYGPGYGPPPPPPGEYGAHAESPVVMVYGLDPMKMNADRVFNIFCLYGNVERVGTSSFRCVEANQVLSRSEHEGDAPLTSKFFSCVLSLRSSS